MFNSLELPLFLQFAHDVVQVVAELWETMDQYDHQVAMLRRLRCHSPCSSPGGTSPDDLPDPGMQ